MSGWFLVPLIALCGLCAFWVHTMKVSPYSAPLLSVCTVILFVYGFGLIQLLQVGLLLITGLGVLLFFYTLFTAPRTFARWQLLFLLAACALLWLRYRNAMLLQYDDFSHWGLIARHLLLHDALPDQSAVLIHFQSYPPAAACWIYSVCFFAGQSEGMMITAQAWFALLALLPLFGVAQKNTPAQSAAIGVLLVIVLSMYHGTASLMVDNLLVSVAVGAAALTVQLRAAPRRSALYTGVVLAVLCLIKDSGLYYALLIAALYTVILYRYRRPARLLLAPVLLPAAVRAVWFLHLRTTLPAAGLTKHALFLSNMRSVSAGRTGADLLAVCKAVAHSVLTRHNQTLLLFLLMLSCCAVIVWLRYVQTGCLTASREGLLLLGAAAAYGLYLLLLLGMYYFTMPMAAALKAVAFERYNITFALFLYGVFAIYLLLIPPASLPFQRLMPVVLACMLASPAAIPAYRGGVRRLLAETYRVPVLEEIAALSQARPLQPGETAALYLGDQSLQEDFISYAAAYKFLRQVPLYTADTLAGAAPPDVLYALTADDATHALEAQGGTEVVTP